MKQLACLLEQEYLGVARIDVSEMPIDQVEILLEKRGIRKDLDLAAKVL
jgi:hypothetical protein